MHFFNPAPVMKLVEVVSTVMTDDDVTETTRALCDKIGKVGVSCADRAGFIVNALLFPYLNDAVKMLEAHYATADDIDTAMKQGCALPMGPFELLDVVGNDVSLAIQRELYLEFREPGFAPAPLLEHLVTAGYLGRKTKRGLPGLLGDPLRAVHGAAGPWTTGPPRAVVSSRMTTSYVAAPCSLAPVVARSPACWSPLRPTPRRPPDHGPGGQAEVPAHAARRTRSSSRVTARTAVRTLQCSLNDVGVGPVVVDGFYGPQTKAAVKEITDGFEGQEPPHPYRINNGFWVLLFGRQLPDSNLALGRSRPGRDGAPAGAAGRGCHGRRRRQLRRPDRVGGQALPEGHDQVGRAACVDEDTRFFLAWAASSAELS